MLFSAAYSQEALGETSNVDAMKDGSKMSNIDAIYQPKNYEQKWYNYWKDKGYFHADTKSSKEPFTILMPPPNVTSQLHMGHGTGYSIQDLLVRWKRMSGYNACWLPGTDHAGIATQMMVEKDLAKEGLSRKELGREAFVSRLQDWKDKYGNIILKQFELMGFSCDWERLAYTMDPKLSDAVRHVFVELYNEGLIYRGERLVNWDCALQTAISDDEIESKEISGHLWYFRYPVEDSDEQIPIATTRPETMLGDTAVAVNPDDERFKHLIGKNVFLPFTGRLVPIVADDYVKSEFGTGAVKITPAHDPNDFAIGKRHKLPMITVMNDNGTMAENTPSPFAGLDRFEARKAVINGLKELGLFDKQENYKHSVPHSERSKTIIEPKLSKQWYVSMKDLAKPAADAARSGDLTFYPDSWKKTYLYWLDNIQDWCISRQLWWGHRIPIWYCNDCQAVTTGTTDPTQCSSCSSANIRQDEDVLDTWFSSWLWPMSPFGWPEEDEKDQEILDTFNPSDVLVTAPEIIFLWVARMVMANLKFKKRLPFKHVYFNATICDHKGRKFSKTLGNGIDPIDVIEAHGADAVRYTALSLAPLGGRVKMATSDFEQGAKFVNKVWNASRFLLQQVDSTKPIANLDSLELTLPEAWLLNELRETADAINQDLSQYRINDAVSRLYHFFWGSFCDWGLECAKTALQGDDDASKTRAISVLVYALEGALRLAHPVIPFITEEIWQNLPSHPDWKREESLTISAYPKAEELRSFPEAKTGWEMIQELITGIRSARQQSGIAPKQELTAVVRCETNEAAIIETAKPWIKRLASLTDITAGAKLAAPSQSLTQVGQGFEVFIPVAGLMDIDKETKRLSAEKLRLSKVLDGLTRKLSQPSFVERAPEDVVAQTTAQKENIETQLASVTRTLASLEG